MPPKVNRVEAITEQDPAAGFTRSVLMKIPTELYEEDQNQIQDKITAAERMAVRDGGYGASGVAEAYVPPSHQRKGALQIQNISGKR